MMAEADGAAVLVFDNVRPPRLTLNELLAGTVCVQVFNAIERKPAEAGLPWLHAVAEVP